MKTIGLDIGSTTLKCAVLDENRSLLYRSYQRHLSRAAQVASAFLKEISKKWPDEEMRVAVSGSAGMGFAEQFSIPFVQEVYAARIAARHYAPGTDAVIELGGEDAKILFLTGGFEMRMNGTCAGGTGAFIDQMASLMNVSPSELNDLAMHHDKVYDIASRCGVFAKSDVQPLLNQGARKEDVAAGILQAVVNQTISGLAQGRLLKGNVLYLGGPLTFFPELRRYFDETLHIHGVCPEHSLYYVALGTALSGSGNCVKPLELSEQILTAAPKTAHSRLKPLFADQDEYRRFLARHEESGGAITEIKEPHGDMFLGIDAGSTTVKLLLCDEQGHIFRPLYTPNSGNPIPIVRKYLESLYLEYPDIRIRSSAVTGYGEEIVKSAFHLDHSLVETVAHFTAAKAFQPDVDFILDIGGQDIKCFQIRGGAIDSIFLNEACSSGCGSFLMTFAGALGYSIHDFSALGLFASSPVDLGSRCTVFMNSSVKQAQKDGATLGDISAGLSISVIKNALYKVIRCADSALLGKNIVVQGGTFLNDAVLRAFETEIGRDVIRPKYAALMGALGAALYAKSLSAPGDRSTVLTYPALRAFRHETRNTVCGGCGNRCHLTVNTFSDGQRYIAGNRCERPVNGSVKNRMNLYAYKRELLSAYAKAAGNEGPVVGIPMGLNLYELLPFWHTFFTSLGCRVITSPPSSRSLYQQGQHTIPSDTVCYPAKLMHGHIEALLKEKPDFIFYPEMSYNVDEGLGTNHFNCPVVAYYPEVIRLNVPGIRDVPFVNDFVSLSNRRQFPKRMKVILDRCLPGHTLAEIRGAAEKAYAEYDRYLENVRKKAQEFLEGAQREGKPVVVLAGRPYHVDPEICHGIDELICSLGAAVITEDSLSHLVKPFPVNVMNQWTYHARLYAAAKFITQAPKEWNLLLVQLVSFGCGVDAITTDEVRAILERANCLYTQIKIDEISNMGAVKIRLRSLFSAALERTKRTNATETHE